VADKKGQALSGAVQRELGSVKRGG